MLCLSLVCIILYDIQGDIVRAHPIVMIIGTRPEGIKMAPVYHALKRAGVPVVVVSTMQHDQLLTDVLDLFDITPDIQLHTMRLGQDLFYITQSILQKTKEIFTDIRPSLVLVQGDTTSSMAAALAAFYLHIPVGHVEAGLRTDDVHAPFPEEMNRRIISIVSAYHFAPTASAVANVLAHGARRDQVFCTGNTVVDALHLIREKIKTNVVTIREDIASRVMHSKEQGKKIMVLTMHRRESFDGGIERVLTTIKSILQNNPELFCFYPYHPNPNVINAVLASQLSEVENMYMCEALSYKDMVYLLDHADLVLTDSGGIQEEAVSLSKPVFVLREKTERMEGVLTGLAHVVGTDGTKIKQYIEKVIQEDFLSLPFASQTYGDGYAAEKIVSILQAKYGSLFEQSDAYIVPQDQVVQSYMTTKDTDMKRVCMLGLGYIGLPTAIVLAEHNYIVVGVDIDINRVKKINSGDPVIHEPEIYEKLHVVQGAGRFRATTTAESADYFIIAVPTPFTEDKKADLSYVWHAVDMIAKVLQKGNVVILESTVPVGCTQQLAQRLAEKTGKIAGKDFYVAHCPERVLPGNIFYELVHNNRVIGGINQTSVKKAKQLYEQFVTGSLYLTDDKTAEMVKLLENSSRDVEIAFAHQAASMARAAGLDPYRVIELANKHPRVNILRPTSGVGGHCIAVDPWFLIETFPEHTQLLHAARMVNDARPQEVIAQINQMLDAWKTQNTRPCTVALFGLTYKANVDDLRESPALYIAQTMINDDSVSWLICEPHVNPKYLPTTIRSYATDVSLALAKTDIAVFLVGHDRFKAIDRKLLAKKRVLDVCGLFYEQTKQADHGLQFWPARGVMDFFITNQVGDEGYEQEI
ncbi:MAG TPA: UDP-N-acetylglucosamine 2-epimerase (non-hydrolyzing) [Candidatus Dependentiae bacterium]|nr:UDP-N-acetylglucosamine 2-epimerase (non-hydrolyzing) [Candidatus Dependentiae bacterium]HRQ63091.1 UDP-N-acetylglucosamine 2-epimerase (non-hydrolyzing) [Candidatus Dependentiae bacterium]